MELSLIEAMAEECEDILTDLKMTSNMKIHTRIMELSVLIIMFLIPRI